MDRRATLAALSALAGHALFRRVLEAWAQTRPAAWRPRALDAAGGDQLTALVDAILPDTDTPGARRAGVHGFVDLVVAECLPAAVAELLRTAEAGRSPFVKTLKSLTVLGYATSQPGATQALAYDPSPGRYRGCVDLAPGQRTWAER